MVFFSGYFLLVFIISGLIIKWIIGSVDTNFLAIFTMGNALFVFLEKDKS